MRKLITLTGIIFVLIIIYVEINRQNHWTFIDDIGVIEKFNNENNMYESEVVFNFSGIKRNKVTDVKVILIDIDNTSKVLEVTRKGGEFKTKKTKIIYSSNQSKRLEETSPEYLIMWTVEGQKFVTNTYKKDNPPIKISNRLSSN